MTTQEAIDHFGSRANLAKALDCSVQAISKWGDLVPVFRAYQLQVITKGKLKAPRQPARSKK